MWALILVLTLAAAGSEGPPDLLRAMLASHSELALFDPQVDLTDPGDYKLEDLKTLGAWPPWVTLDLDGDGRKDVAAVVVRRDKSPHQFGLLAVHAGSPARLYWIRPMSEEVIFGVGRRALPRTIVPLNCLECDSNAWYRWSDGTYQVALYEAADRIVLSTSDVLKRLGLLKSPRLGSKVLQEIAQCTTAKVVRVVGVAFESRWYLVDIPGQKGLRGWIPASSAIEDPSCPE